jgi:hypothetical protein
LSEQGEKMIDLARNYFNKPEEIFSNYSGTTLNEQDAIIWDIGYFGSKALKFGTIDTYAKKLHLNSSHEELTKLKISVSIFFTIWQLTEDKTLKSREESIFDAIDKRYITLMAAIL